MSVTPRILQQPLIRSLFSSRMIPAKWLVRWIWFSFAALNALFMVRFTFLLILQASESSTGEILFMVVGIIITISMATWSLRMRSKWSAIFFLSGLLSVVVILALFIISYSFIDQLLVDLSSSMSEAFSNWIFGLFLWAFMSWLIIKVWQSWTLLAPFPAEDIGSPRRLTSILTLAVIVIGLALTSYWIYFQILRPAPIYVNYDPEMAYLYNSISPFADQQLYRRMDHPGTPLQLLGSTFYFVTYPLGLFQPSTLIWFHLNNPIILLFVARTFLLAIHLTALIILSFYVFQPSNVSSLFAALSVATLYFGVHSQSISFLTIWSPNAFNYAVGTLTLLGLFLVFRNNPILSGRQIFVLGFVTGIVATFQIYMILWLVGAAVTIFIYRCLNSSGWLMAIGAATRVGLGGLLGFFLASVIILNQYPSFFRWLLGLFWKQGRYGSGDPGITNPTILAENFDQLWASHPELFVVSVILAFAFLLLLIIHRKKLSLHAGLWALGLGLTFQIGLLFFIIVKHPHERYLLSVAATLPIMLAVIFSLIDDWPWGTRWLATGVFVLIMLGFLVNLGANIRDHGQYMDSDRVYAKVLNDVLAEELPENDGRMDRPTILWTYNTRSECYARWFGNAWARQTFHEDLEQICPKDLNLDIWNKTVLVDGKRIPLRDFDGWSAIITIPRFVERLGIDGESQVIPTMHPDLVIIVPDT